jgi:hypothetical protein
MSTAESVPYYDPYAPYSLQNVPPLEEQVRFFGYALRTGKAAGMPRRVLAGPHRELFLEETRLTGRRLADIGEDVTAEYLHGVGYRLPHVVAGVAAYTDAGKSLPRAALQHRRSLEEMGSHIYTLGLAGQAIAEGALARPPQLYQGKEEGHLDDDGTRMCFNACFRMVFAAIAGWVPSEVASSRAMRPFNHGSAIGRQQDYCDVFRSPPFSDRVRTVLFTGADFSFIGSFAQRLHARNPRAKLYTILNTDSLSAYRPNAWHALVLNHVSETRVHVQDPRLREVDNVTSLDKQRFAKIWGVGLNSGCFVIDMAPRIRKKPPEPWD